MTVLNKTPLIVALACVGVLILLLGGGAMTGSMGTGGMMAHGWTAGLNWMWIPTAVAVGVGVMLAWFILGRK